MGPGSGVVVSRREQHATVLELSDSIEAAIRGAAGLAPAGADGPVYTLRSSPGGARSDACGPGLARRGPDTLGYRVPTTDRSPERDHVGWTRSRRPMDEEAVLRGPSAR